MMDFSELFGISLCLSITLSTVVNFLMIYKNKILHFYGRSLTATVYKGFPSSSSVNHWSTLEEEVPSWIHDLLSVVTGSHYKVP